MDENNIDEIAHELDDMMKNRKLKVLKQKNKQYKTDNKNLQQDNDSLKKHNESLKLAVASWYPTVDPYNKENSLYQYNKTKLKQLQQQAAYAALIPTSVFHPSLIQSSLFQPNLIRTNSNNNLDANSNANEELINNLVEINKKQSISHNKVVTSLQQQCNQLLLMNSKQNNSVKLGDNNNNSKLVQAAQQKSSAQSPTEEMELTKEFQKFFKYFKTMNFAKASQDNDSDNELKDITLKVNNNKPNADNNNNNNNNADNNNNNNSQNATSQPLSYTLYIFNAISQLYLICIVYI